MNTASTKSAITYIDGDAGILRYRGYPIEQLAEKSTFIEVSYLLIYGELPTAEQLADFTTQIQRHTPAARGPQAVLRRLPAQRPPDAGAVQCAVNALSAYYQDSGWTRSTTSRSSCPRSGCWPRCRPSPPTPYKKSVGQPFLYPDNSLSLVENFLRMTFGLPAEPYQPDPEIVRALDMLLILHADHEQNCSTSTVRLVGSSQANLFTSISGGINALWGPLHGGGEPGGAGDARAHPPRADNVQDFVRKVKNREDGVKLMGFGHRVYKNYDPRARDRRRAGRTRSSASSAAMTKCSTSPSLSKRSP